LALELENIGEFAQKMKEAAIVLVVQSTFLSYRTSTIGTFGGDVIQQFDFIRFQCRATGGKVRGQNRSLGTSCLNRWYRWR
jgi:hypothetical protein